MLRTMRPGDANPETSAGWHKLEFDFQIVITIKGSSAMSSPEELTFVIGRWVRPIVIVLHVVRRITFQPISSREQESTTPIR